VKFLDRFSKNTERLTFMRIRPVGAELFSGDGQTDGCDEANNRFWEALRTSPKITWLWRASTGAGGELFCRKSRVALGPTRSTVWWLPAFSLGIKRSGRKADRSDVDNGFFYYQCFIYSSTDAPVNCLKNNIKIYIETAPTCFGVTVKRSPESALICAY